MGRMLPIKVEADLIKNLTNSYVVNNYSTGAYMDITIKNNGKGYDLTNKTVKAYMLKSDGKIIFEDCNIETTDEIKCTLDFTTEMLTAKTLTIQFLVTDSDGDSLATNPIFISIGDTIINVTAIESSNEFIVFQQALKSLNEYTKKVDMLENEQLDSSAIDDYIANYIGEYGLTVNATNVNMADGTTVEDNISSLKEDLVNANDNITSNRKNTTFDVTTTWTSGKAIVATNDNLGTEGTTSILKLSDYIDLTNADAITFTVPIYAQGTSYGYVLYDKNKTAVKGVQFSNGGSYSSFVKTLDVSNYSYMRTGWFKDTASYGDFKATCKKISIGGLKSYVKGQDIIVAASDSNAYDKARADYICDGINDEDTIQQAMDNLGTTGTCWLCSGNYYIDSFKEADDGGQAYAIRFKINGQSSNKLKGYSYPSRKNGTNNQFTNCAILNVTQSCYDSLDNDTIYTLIRAECRDGKRVYPNVKVNVSEIAFKLPDNKKNIIGIDGYYATSMNIENIFGNALYSDANMDKADTLHIGAENCIGIRGMQGSNFGAANLWKSCFMWGFGTAYDCSGEHLIIEDCGSRVCNKPWIFRSSLYGAGYLVHPMTVINCCSELDFNYPIFKKNEFKQAINIIGFNFEHYNDHFDLGGDYAKEEVPGQWRGTINYTIQNFNGSYCDKNLSNVVTGRFWADGNGYGMVTKNDAQLAGGTTAERLTYGANFMQKYYDTDLSKLLIYDGDKWLDTAGTTVSTSVKSIAFSSNTATIPVGGTVQTSYTILPEDATNKEVTYLNTDATVAKTNTSTGVITGLKEGTCKITVFTKDGSYKDSITVTVTE